MDSLDAKQLAEKPRKIGSFNGKPVYGLRTKGGYHLIVTPKDGRFETLGAGPLAAVAKFIATRKNEGIEWSELEKSETISQESLNAILPQYEDLTKQIRTLQGDEKE